MILELLELSLLPVGFFAGRLLPSFSIQKKTKYELLHEVDGSFVSFFPKQYIPDGSDPQKYIEERNQVTQVPHASRLV